MWPFYQPGRTSEHVRTVALAVNAEATAQRRSPRRAKGERLSHVARAGAEVFEKPSDDGRIFYPSPRQVTPVRVRLTDQTSSNHSL